MKENMGGKTNKELLKLADEEYSNGMRHMLSHLQKEATVCNGKDNCLICRVGNKYLNKRIREVKNG